MSAEELARLWEAVARLPNHSLDHLHTAEADAAWDRAVDERLGRLAEREGEG